MAGKTLKDIALLINVSVDDLREKIAKAGVKINDDDVLSDEQRRLLISATKKSSSKISIKKPLTVKKTTEGSGFQLTVKKKKAVAPVQKVEEIVEDKLAIEEPAVEKNDTVVVEEVAIVADSSEKLPEKDTVKTVKSNPTVDTTAKKDKREKKPREEWSYKKEEQPSYKQRRKHKNSRASHASRGASTVAKSTDVIIKTVKIPEAIRVADLAQKMSIKSVELMKIMMTNNVIATVNQMLDQETAAIIVEMAGHKYELLHEDELERDLQEIISGNEQELPRAPVVTIMGHVDHGKTTLLDYIRSSRVTAKEAGGITQHIGAYHVETSNGAVTFLDTPGHEAFTAMRARGTKITDIVILVVAADDGVMPQTLEAIAHAKAGGVPIVVAVNKMDKPAADPDRVMTELSTHDVIPDTWGGDVLFKNISAKTGEGVDALLEDLALQSEMMELKADVNGLAQGVIIESKLDKGRGPVITVLVQSGYLRKGDVILAGQEFGKVRSIIDDCGTPVDESGPAMPVEVLGLSGLPKSGDRVVVVPSEKKAREVALYRRGKYRDVKLAKNKPAGLESLFDNVKSDEVATLNIVLKTDVDGSVEAINESLLKLSTDRVKVAMVSMGVGAISESDANLALASNAIIVGFNVRADSQARDVIDREEIRVYYYSIIYDLIAEVKSAMKGLAAPQYRDKQVGLAEVREVFRSSKHGVISGCMVLNGIVKRGSLVRILRDNIVIFNSEISSVRRFKEDVAEVRQGMECGISIKDYRDVKEKDQLEIYVKELVEVEI